MRKIILIIFSSLLISQVQIFAQWNKQYLPSDLGIVLSVDVRNNAGITGGWKYDVNYMGGGLAYTTNYGIDWLSSSCPDSLRSIVTVQFINNSLAYSCGAYNVSLFKNIKFNSFDKIFRVRTIHMEDTAYKGMFLKSVNSGLDWVPINSIPYDINYLLGLKFIDANTGYATGDISYGTLSGLAAIIKTTNGGLNWAKLILPDTISEVRNIDFVNSFTGYGAGYINTGDSNNPYKGIIIKTTDGGINWEVQEFNEVNTFNDIVFINQYTGYASGNGPYALSGVTYKTINAGTNWIKLTNELNDAFYLGCDAAGNSIAVVGQFATYNPYVYRPIISFSKDGGNNWTTYIFNDTSFLLNDGFMKDNNIWYLAGGNISDTALIYYTQSGGEIGLINNNEQIPEYLYIEKIYPNPFNPTTTIFINVNVNNLSENVLLEVYNVLGQKIEKLLDSHLPQGKYKLFWNAGKNPGGIYFLKLTYDNYSVSKKMIYVK